MAFADGQEPNVSYFSVTPHLLKTLNVPLVAGRDFTDAEGQGRSAVAIVNGVFAKRLWPNRTDVKMLVCLYPTPSNGASSLDYMEWDFPAVR